MNQDGQLSDTQLLELIEQTRRELRLETDPTTAWDSQTQFWEEGQTKTDWFGDCTYDPRGDLGE